ncbi:hypothetical protein [Streptomyces sp. SID3343]|uniref:hypothetical protein n=1 Tax=Streptomyces sp. SID3343 TaxID=2690260 RepID=UPI0013715AFE|nr:hypothetical protein [Streptomyces sp. SID3343]MYV97000.1 hypothetical protein [Streptomyces sp. SID3343]MYW03238.1 hypothetical protein [Streptomyces sp. SID3343]
MSTPPEHPDPEPEPTPTGPASRHRRLAVALSGLLLAAVATGIGDEIGHRLVAHAPDAGRALLE